jgi:hypothetical protein
MTFQILPPPVGRGEKMRRLIMMIKLELDPHFYIKK